MSTTLIIQITQSNNNCFQIVEVNIQLKNLLWNQENIKVNIDTLIMLVHSVQLEQKQGS
jgi:hypothetical protein